MIFTKAPADKLSETSIRRHVRSVHSCAEIGISRLIDAWQALGNVQTSFEVGTVACLIEAKK